MTRDQPVAPTNGPYRSDSTGLPSTSCKSAAVLDLTPPVADGVVSGKPATLVGLAAKGRDALDAAMIISTQDTPLNKEHFQRSIEGERQSFMTLGHMRAQEQQRHKAGPRQHERKGRRSNHNHVKEIRINDSDDDSHDGFVMKPSDSLELIDLVSPPRNFATAGAVGALGKGGREKMDEDRDDGASHTTASESVAKTSKKPPQHLRHGHTCDGRSSSHPMNGLDPTLHATSVHEGHLHFYPPLPDPEAAPKGKVFLTLSCTPEEAELLCHLNRHNQRGPSLASQHPPQNIKNSKSALLS